MRTTSLLAIAGLAIGAAATAQIKGPSTAQTPYMVPSDPTSGVVIYSVISNGNGSSTPDETYTNLGTGVANSYRLVGIPDGLGALGIPGEDSASTFTVLSNHELGNTSGVARRHGSRGALVSKWRINREVGTPTFLSVSGGEDLMRSVALWNTGFGSNPTGYSVFNSSAQMPIYSSTTGAYTAAASPFNGFGRFCSSDLARPSAYRFGAFGTDERILLNGEEIGSFGRPFAHVVTGPDAGNSFELPEHGDYSWENNLASPFPQLKTVCIGTDDSSPGFISVYVGEKKAAGNDVERAGLTGGNFYIFKLVNGQTSETLTNILGNGAVSTSERFTLQNFGDVRAIPGNTLRANGNAAGQMKWARPEDGAWDPSIPGRFYFVTTGNASVGVDNSRLWQIQFDDITNPAAGGVVSMLFDGSNLAGTLAGGFVSATGLTNVVRMDNICVTRFGDIVIEEDVGNDPRLGRKWFYRVGNDSLLEIGIPDAARFATGGASFLTIDEETSGVVDAWDEIGPGWFLFDMQAHYTIAGELAEGGQIMAMYLPQSLPSPAACPGDANFDRRVDFSDLNTILNTFGRNGVGIPGDLNRNGLVNLEDLNTALTNFGVTCR